MEDKRFTQTRSYVKKNSEFQKQRKKFHAARIHNLITRLGKKMVDGIMGGAKRGTGCKDKRLRQKIIRAFSINL